MGRLWHTTNIYMHSPIHEYAEKLTSLLPDPLKVIYLTNSGSEANDLAMLMARVYTGNFDVITFRGGYHGASPYAMGLTSMAAYKYPIATGIGCHTTMCPDVFRGPWGGSGCRDSPVQTIRECNCSPDCCQANDMYVQQLKEVLDTSVSQQIAGFFAEPIQGIGGVVQYPKGFLKEAYKLVRERGGVCIADETIEEDGLQQNSTQVGTYLLTELAKLRDKFGIIGDIRGKGLLIGVEMVKDKVSREPLPGVEMNEIFEDCKDMGLLIGKGGVYGQMSRIKPPMCITKDDADFALAVFGLAIQRQMARRL
ncbi:alanine--glyoxylate aminotransferase 2, mitochondrial isoform X1 [Acipenser ruthenus]|uniref:alanine--glyoxylate aminotransferase 2, mitochondrial isoform X1 n=2 Tax=Acipenser ruthenus TaxID=7906 RepID=UPI0027412E04|nr:alanine--glyoxylate aminotransferase 2, mitochondrial isoform X1 [Acipenser ruthenus]XP_058851648.1 alanine--glyoxylate aminotransferase 2, mitochondrial isoform X1 [Acipenser ruthenus]